MAASLTTIAAGAQAPPWGPGAVAETAVAPRRPIQVLLLDDHPAVRAGVAQVLDDERDIVLVASAATGQEALAAADARALDVAVVDYELGGENGLALARKLTKLTRPPRILMYTAYADAPMAIAAIVAGADGLLSKASFGDELCHAIRMLARGRSRLPAISRDVATSVLARLGARERTVAAMLIHGLHHTDVARTLNITDAELDALRWSILEALTASPTGDRRPPRRGHAGLDHDRLVRPREPLRAGASPGGGM